ncbi:pectinesterase family protein [Streptomyces arenae]|uniref:pectinesterase family protein n=1 Tax=Streptomyces arenae TaxID=29301 RepID=UPI002658C06C|nr:pectinesterase family protein [Streptomyces arenae]MCG7209633.1 pectinesterase family protein [Streptomyces arenae]
MTSTTRDGLPRRSFLAAATAVSLAAAGGLVLGSASLAAAATGATVTWRLSSEPADARAGYAALLNSIRNAIRAGSQRPDPTGPSVDVTDINGTNSYITVDLHAEDRPEFIRVVMRRSDAYVMGWFQATEDGTGAVTFGDFFPLEAGLNPGQGGIPQGRPAGTFRANDPGSQSNVRFNTLAGYDALARQGANRSGMQISPASLNSAVLNLQAGDSVPIGLAASSILQIIVAVAEGSRFRNQAADTVTAFGNGLPYTVTQQAMAHHNNWAIMSAALLTGLAGAGAVLTAPLDIGAGVVFVTLFALQRAVMTAYHSNIPSTRGKGLLAKDQSSFWVQTDGMGDYPTIQAAVNAAPSDGIQRILYLAKGTYQETPVVPSSARNLMIEGERGSSTDQVVITADRAHGTINPATGQIFGTEGSAVLTVKASGVTVAGITIQNTFDPKKHPEIDAFSTQAVALAAEGDRQTYTQCRIIARQDTILVKSPVPTAENRQYFVGSYIEGAIDFIFGSATAVFDRCNIAIQNWVGGTVLAPNTDQSKKYGILITGSTIWTNGVPANTMYLGRPWHNGSTVWPQALVRDTVVHGGITVGHPWTNMDTTYDWAQARLSEYNNTYPDTDMSSAPNPSAPQMTATQAADYTAQKYLAGTDGWNPVF